MVRDIVSLSFPRPGLLLPLLLLLFLPRTISAVTVPSSSCIEEAFNATTPLPTEIHVRAPVLLFRPMAFLDNSTDGFGGFMIDLLRRLEAIAMEQDAVNLTFSLEINAEESANGLLSLIADDCETTANRPQDCGRYDMVIGDFWPTPARWKRVDFTPAFWTTGFASMKLPGSQPKGLEISTLEQAVAANQKACVLKDSAIVAFLDEVQPSLEQHLCGPLVDDCAHELTLGNCALFPWDDLTLGYYSVRNPQFLVTKERLRTTTIVWAMRRAMNRQHSHLIKNYLYHAAFTGVLDELYNKYYSVQLCPIGKAGPNCDRPCHGDHGRSNRLGECVCDSTRYTGADCSTEVVTDLHLLSPGLLAWGYVMFGINAFAVLFCTAWLHWKRRVQLVVISQRFFLHLILLGCLISSLTILSLGMQDEGEEPVFGCMLSPWLYSVGFSITFGTLFAKLRRISLLFEASVSMRRAAVTAKDTMLLIGGVLLIDTIILTVWTAYSPLEWTRTVDAEDIFGYPLSSVGQCQSEHWIEFVVVIAVFHLLLLTYATYLCYASRHIDTNFSGGKYLAIAMVSNFQIYIVGVPLLIMVGSNPTSAYFVRSIIIWMNDFAVIALIFGNLMYSVHFERNSPGVQKSMRTVVNTAMKDYRSAQAGESSFIENSSNAAGLNTSMHTGTGN